MLLERCGEPAPGARIFYIYQCRSRPACWAAHPPTRCSSTRAAPRWHPCPQCRLGITLLVSVPTGVPVSKCVLPRQLECWGSPLRCCHRPRTAATWAPRPCVHLTTLPRSPSSSVLVTTVGYRPQKARRHHLACIWHLPRSHEAVQNLTSWRNGSSGRTRAHH